MGALWKLYFHPRIKAKQNSAIAQDEAIEEIAKKSAGILQRYIELWESAEERLAEKEMEFNELREQANALNKDLAMCTAKCETMQSLLNEHEHRRYSEAGSDSGSKRP